MNIAFAIVTLFPGGGLQRDCMAIASRLAARGHHITIFAERTRGALPQALTVKLLPNRAWTNHGRDQTFADDVVRTCRGRFDRLVGFGKLKDLDILYCADPCVAASPTTVFSRLSDRRRTMMRLEGASFAPGARTRCLLLSERQLRDFRDAWSTEPERLTLLPPTIDRARRQPALRSSDRDALRTALGIKSGEWAWLAIGNQPRVKGLDRAVAALEEFPEARLLIAGIEPNTKHARIVQRWARQNSVRDRVTLLGMRDDIPQVMAASDLLVHPARYDTTGAVILEAAVNGLPVITTEACGYASHVVAADAGLVISEPFQSSALIDALRQAQFDARAAQWSANGVAYGAKEDLYSGLDRAADVIAADR